MASAYAICGVQPNFAEVFVDPTSFPFNKIWRLLTEIHGLQALRKTTLYQSRRGSECHNGIPEKTVRQLNFTTRQVAHVT